MKILRLKFTAVALAAFLLIVPFFSLNASAGEPETSGTETKDSTINSAQFTVVVDYYAEVIRVISREDGDNKDFIEVGTEEQSTSYAELSRSFLNSSENSVKCMYALKSPSAELLGSYKPAKRITVLTGEKYYPMYGGIDISKVIPKKDPTLTKNYYHIAVRLAEDKCNSVTAYETRIAVRIKSRFDSKDLKKNIIYNADEEKYMLESSYRLNSLTVLYAFDYFGYSQGTLTKSADDVNNISVPASNFASGASLAIRAAPIFSASDNSVVAYASSDIIKLKVPKAPALPTVNLNSAKASLVSLKKTSQWSFTNNGEDWEDYDGAATLALKDIKEKLGAFGSPVSKPEDTISSKQYYVIYFRTKPVEKKTPASEVKTIYIPIEDIPS